MLVINYPFLIIFDITLLAKKNLDSLVSNSNSIIISIGETESAHKKFCENFMSLQLFLL